MITARPLVEADLPAVVALLHAYDDRWFAEPVLTSEDVAAEWRSPAFDLSTDSEGWDDDGTLVAFGTLSARGGIELAVDETWADAGLEDALLERWEREARRRDLVEVHRHLAAADAPGRARLERRGWTVLRTGWLLRLSPATLLEPRPVPAGYAIRPLAEDDLPATYRVLRDAFAVYSPTTRSYEDWRAGTIDRPDVVLAHCRVATWRDEVVGACLVMDPPPGPEPGAAEPEAWVPQLGVGAEHRRRGLARELLVQTALAARARRVPTVGLYTHSGTGALGLYEGVGMVVRHTLVECALTLGS